MAKKIGTSGSIVGRYEREEIKPSIEVASKLADSLGFIIDYLIGSTEKVGPDKKLMRRIEDIEELLAESIKYFIDMAPAYNKTEKVFANNLKH